MKLWKFILTLIATGCIVGAWLGWDYYSRLFVPSIKIAESTQEFYIESKWSFSDVCDALYTQNLLQDTNGFAWVARYKRYNKAVKPGRFLILDGMNNNQLVNLLRSTNEPVNVLIRSVREQDDFVRQVSSQLELDEGDLSKLLTDDGFCQRYGFTPATIFSLFIPNIYEFYWNTSATEFVDRMAREFKRFWNDDRKAKAKALGLSQTEVSILASIVQAEQTAHADERPAVAGLYLNRLKKGMRLESDPTLIKAIGDYTIRRVLKKHKEIDSPFNTYKRAGLPPAPILLPEPASLDAVLNASSHNYLYMCAKEDFSGYHNFTSSYRAHLKNARKYRQALNDKKIYR